MTDYMKEAGRLVQDLISAVDFEDQSAETKARAALLAHIQRGAVPEGWQVVPKEPTKDMVEAAYDNVTGGGGRAAIYAAMLAAAPAPDHFRDAAKMVAVPADDHIAPAIHYPECWDTAAYPTVESALSEVFAHYRCTEHDAPAEVPMPEEDGWFCWAGSERGHSPFFSGYEPLAHSERERAFTLTKMRTYGAACRAAGEAAGYARGMKEAGRDAERLQWMQFHGARVEWSSDDEYCCVAWTDRSDAYRTALFSDWRDAIDAALRGEVKP